MLPLSRPLSPTIGKFNSFAGEMQRFNDIHRAFFYELDLGVVAIRLRAQSWPVGGNSLPALGGEGWVAGFDWEYLEAFSVS